MNEDIEMEEDDGPNDGDPLDEVDDPSAIDEEDEDDNETDAEIPPQPVWYEQVRAFLEHVCKVNAKICKHPSNRISIDEMLRKFLGRSAQTYRMKRKPDKEGYKFFALCCSITGFKSKN